MSATTHLSLTNSQGSAALPRRGGSLARLIATLQTWRQRIRERRALAAMSQRELADFGASTADVQRELATPFWRALPPC